MRGATAPAIARQTTPGSRTTVPPLARSTSSSSAAGNQLGSSFSVPELVQLTGSSLFRRPESGGASGGSSFKKNRPLAMDSNFWESENGYAEDVPMVATLAVRRLMPTTPAKPNSPSNRKASPSDLAEMGSSASGSLRPLRQQAPPDNPLVCRSVSSPSRKTGGNRQAQLVAINQIDPRMSSGLTLSQTQPALESEASQELDLKALARESIMWLDELPKQERTSAMVEMRQWVKNSGIEWDLWWQYCLRSRQEARQVSQTQQMVMGPTFLGPNSSRPRVVAPEFNPVPPQMKAYNTQVAKGRPNVSRQQLHRSKSQPSAPQITEKRPSSEDGWKALAMEALAWMSTKTKQERPAAMAQMRQWIIQSGLNWDAWWTYCRRLEDQIKQEEQLRPWSTDTPVGGASPAGWLPQLQEDTPHGVSRSMTAPIPQPPTPSSPTSPTDEEYFGDERRGAVLVDGEALEKAEKDAKEEASAARRAKKADRQAREEARIAQAAQWEADSAKSLAKEYHEGWKNAVRSYTAEMFAPAS